MKILFVGTVHFSATMLHKLIEINADLVGVVTGSDLGVNSDYANLAPVCAENNIDCWLTKEINNPETIAWIKSKNPDVIFCFGWSRLLGDKFLAIPKIGVVGFHPTELPKNRGRHPLIWALVLGLKETASSFFFMNGDADSGDLLSQERILIDDQDDAQSLYKKIEQLAEIQLMDIVVDLERGHYQQTKQDDNKANYWRKRSASDGVIDWRMSARSIHNLVRGLSYPYVGAEFSLNDRVFKVWKSEIVELPGTENHEPGKVVDITHQGNAVIRCGEQCITLLQTEPVFHIKKGQYL